MTTLIPTAKLRIIDASNANEEILSFARNLQAEGERPWFEVRYPSPDYLTEEESLEWQARQETLDGEGTYDAVEVINGEIIALPDYRTLEAGEG